MVQQRWLLNAVKLTVTAAKSMMQPVGGGGPGGEGVLLSNRHRHGLLVIILPTSSQRRYGKCETARSWALLLASLICMLIAHLRTFGSLLYPTCAHEPRHTASSFIPDDRRDKPWPTGGTSTPLPWLCEIDVRRPMFRYTMLVRHIQVALI